MENIQYGFKTKDGLTHPINVRGADNLTEAVFEVVARLLKGGTIEVDGRTYTADDIIEYIDIPG